MVRWIDPERRAAMDARAKRELDQERERELRRTPLIEEHPDDYLGIDEPARLTDEELVRAIVKREIDEEHGKRTAIVRELPALRAELDRRARKSADGWNEYGKKLGAERARQEGLEPL